jgi:hypothetical protein
MHTHMPNTFNMLVPLNRDVAPVLSRSIAQLRHFLAVQNQHLTFLAQYMPVACPPAVLAGPHDRPACAALQPCESRMLTPLHDFPFILPLLAVYVNVYIDWSLLGQYTGLAQTGNSMANVLVGLSMWSAAAMQA